MTLGAADREMAAEVAVSGLSDGARASGRNPGLSLGPEPVQLDLFDELDFDDGLSWDEWFRSLPLVPGADDEEEPGRRRSG